jgi:hypothetical protein
VAKGTSRIRRLLSPRVFDNPQKTDAARMLYVVALTGAVAATTAQLLALTLVSAGTSRWLLNILVIDGICLLAILVARLGLVRAATIFFLAAVWIFVTQAAWTAGGVGAPSIAGQLVVVVLAGLLLGWRGSLAAVAVSVATVFAFAYAQRAGRVPAPSVVHTPYSRALVIASYAVIVGLISAQITRLLQQARRRLEGQLVKTSLLLDTAEGLASWTELTRVLDAICDSVLVATRHTRVGIALYDARRRDMTVAASRGNKPYAIGAVFSYGSLPAAAKQALEAARTTAAHASAVVPLAFGSRIIGMMTIDDPGERRQFTQRQVALAEGIAAQAAVAIENARLFEAEHRIAEKLQESLLAFPAVLPGLECARLYSAASASERVGGDFYDAFDLGLGKVALTVGDVSGKGLDAAALTALVRNALRSYAIGGLSPGEALLMGNEVVRRFTDAETFVTLFFGILDTERRVLTYSSAGHPPPIVVGERASFLPTGGSWLFGAFEEAGFAESQFRLGPGDTLLLYTDGITEARDGTSALYGEERLRRRVEELRGEDPEGLLRNVFADARRFAHGELHDDIALVAVRVAAASQDSS